MQPENDSQDTVEETQSIGSDSHVNQYRRKFLRKSAASIGLIGGGLSMTSLGAACDPNSGSYQRGDLEHYMFGSAQPVSDECDSIDNYGVRIDYAGTLVYWDSADWGDGEYSHHFSSNTHAEHFDQDWSTCEWTHYPGLYQQRWSAKDELSENVVAEPNNPDWVGANPPVSEDNSINFGDTAWTGLDLALSYAWPASKPVLTAAEVTYALTNDFEYDSNSAWDVVFNWDHGYEYHSCLSHYIKFNANGSSPEADVYTEEGVWNDYQYAEITHHDHITPEYNTSSSITSSQTVSKSESSPRSDVEPGDVIYPDDKPVRVDSVNRVTRHHPGGPPREVDPKAYRKRHPNEVKKRGRVPERILRLSGVSTTTSLTGTLIE